MTKLKSCPFCGGEGRFGPGICNAGHVQCIRCGVSSRIGGTVEEAIDNWNNRWPSAESLSPLFNEILQERIRQNEKWGEQNHPMIKGFTVSDCKKTLGKLRKYNDKEKDLCWHNILAEEFLEAFAETDYKKQREEMIQVAAVAVQIIEYLDRLIAVNK